MDHLAALPQVLLVSSISELWFADEQRLTSTTVLTTLDVKVIQTPLSVFHERFRDYPYKIY
jgi:hypothetical protein